MALGVGVGRLLPATETSKTHWAEETLGAAFGVLGIVLLWVGYVRVRAVEDALDRGTFAPLDVRLPVALLGAGILLGIGVVALVVFGG
jgi:uncharacterized membrane protein YidH (DUF202 family)